MSGRIQKLSIPEFNKVSKRRTFKTAKEVAWDKAKPARPFEVIDQSKAEKVMYI